MKLGEMRKILSDCKAKRTWHLDPRDARFIALAANTYDKLLAVAEAAKLVLARIEAIYISSVPEMKDLKYALKNLESE